MLKTWTTQMNYCCKSLLQGRTVAVVGIYSIGFKLFINLLKEKFPQYHFIEMDFEGEQQMTAAKFWKILCREIFPGVRNYPAGLFEIKHVFKDLPGKICLVIHNAQNLILNENDFLKDLEELRYEYQHMFSLVLTGEPQIYFRPEAGLTVLIKNNYIFLQPLSRQDTLSDIALQEKHLGFNFQHKTEFIYKYSQGVHGTIKFLCQQS